MLVLFSFLAKNAKAKSKIAISNFDKKNVQLNFELENCGMSADGGTNGLLLRLQDISSAIEISGRSEETKCPSYKIEFGILATECRVDSAYNQTTPILAFRLSSFNIKLNDSWESNLDTK